MFHVKHFAEIFMNSTLDMKIKRNFRECRNGEKMARGLGKGIDVLIPEVKHSTGKDEKKVVKEVVKEVLKETNEIDINKVEPNENQPRKEFNEDALQELADSIKQHGLIEPIIVQISTFIFPPLLLCDSLNNSVKIISRIVLDFYLSFSIILLIDFDFRTKFIFQFFFILLINNL